ncbi:unnamed protein product [Trichobilharzia szidati]|nr:unnamed protein product [Trichobilharzia szidati]
MPRLSLFAIFPGVFHSHLSTLSLISGLPLDEQAPTSQDVGLHFWLNRSSDLNFSDFDGFNGSDVANVSYDLKELSNSAESFISFRNQDSSDASRLSNYQHHIEIISNQAKNNVMSDKSGGKIMFEVVTAATASEEAFLNRSSVLFVAVSFILLMVISLAWLVFYYVQRFRYLHSKERVSRRLAELAKKAVARIPIKTLHPGDREITTEYEQCAICIEAFRPLDNIRILPCRHYFHKTCIDPWLLEQRSCPMCKLDILQAYGFRAELFCSYANLDNLNNRATSGSTVVVSSVSTTSPGLMAGSLSNTGVDDEASAMESVSLVTSQSQVMNDILTATCGPPPLTYVVLAGTNGTANAADSIIIHAQSCSKTNEQLNLTNSISSHLIQSNNMNLPSHSVKNSIAIPLLSNLSFPPNQLTDPSMWSKNLLPVCVVTSVTPSESYQGRALMVCESLLGSLLSQTCSAVTATIGLPNVHPTEHSFTLSMNAKEATTSTTQSLMGPLCSTTLDSEISSAHPMNFIYTNYPDQLIKSQINNLPAEHSKLATYPMSNLNTSNSSQYPINQHNWQIINLHRIIQNSDKSLNSNTLRNDHSSMSLFRNWLSSHWRNTFSRSRSNNKRVNRLSYHTPSYYTVTSTPSTSDVVNSEDFDQSKSNLIIAKRQSTSTLTTKECYVTAVVEDVPSETGNSSTLSESVNIPTSDYSTMNQSVNTLSLNLGVNTTADIVFSQ